MTLGCKDIEEDKDSIPLENIDDEVLFYEPM